MAENVKASACPFCGNTDLTLREGMQDEFDAAVFCKNDNCCARMLGSSLAVVLSRWNRRADPQEGNWISAEDYYRNVKLLDEALNGVGGATRPLLIDVLGQVQGEVRKWGRPLLVVLKKCGKKMS